MDRRPDPYPTRKHAPRLPADCYTGRATAFLTICVRDRRIDLTAGATPAALAFAMGGTSGRTEHLINAWTIMPDHVHALVEGVDADADIREWVRRFKQRSSLAWRARTGGEIPRAPDGLAGPSLRNTSESVGAGWESRPYHVAETARAPGLWQRGFYDRVLRSSEPIERVCRYIFDNPTRKDLCRHWTGWAWSGGRYYDVLYREWWENRRASPGGD